MMMFLTFVAVLLAIWPRLASDVRVPRETGRLANQVGKRRRLRLGREARSAALPAVIDGVAVVVGAGGTISEAIRLLADWGPPAVREAMSDAAKSRDRGLGTAESLDRLATQLGDDYFSMSAALIASERDGAPLALVLARLGDEATLVRRTQSEARAKRLPVQLLFPLVVCFLPAVLIGAVLPLVIVSFGQII